MENSIKALLVAFLLLIGCNSINASEHTKDEETSTVINNKQFQQLLETVSNGWKANDAKMAASSFTLDAVYIEPPDRQLYSGKKEIFEFFGGDSGRKDPMNMTWHYITFDKEKQIGTAEYTFEYKGRLSHGIVIVQVFEGKIRRWREYQYRSQQSWQQFIGTSHFN